MDITELLAFSVKNNASDLHLSAGLPPIIRVDGEMRRLNVDPLDHKQVHALVYEIMNDKQRKEYEENLETDFSFEYEKADFGGAAIDSSGNPKLALKFRYRFTSFKSNVDTCLKPLKAFAAYSVLGSFFTASSNKSADSLKSFLSRLIFAILFNDC